jgi:hypothetical protein
MGNLSPEEFAGRVGADFTHEEIAVLRSTWSRMADLSGPEDWHIFDSPSISITVGNPTARALAILVRANDRHPSTRLVDVDIDERWNEGSSTGVS